MNAKQTKKDKIYVLIVLSSFVCLFLNFSAVAMYSSVMKCCYSNFSDPEMLGFVNKLLTLPRYKDYFGSFRPENSLNRGVRYNEPSI